MKHEINEDTNVFLTVHLLTDGYKDVDNFEEDELRTYIIADGGKNQLEEGVEFFNRYFGFSFSTSIKEEERIVLALYAPNIIGKYEELVFELKKHPTQKNALILLSNYGPVELTLDLRCRMLVAALNALSKKIKDVYLPSGIKLLDNLGANHFILSLMEGSELNAEDGCKLAEFLAEIDRISYFPMRNQMMMINMLDFNLLDMEHTKIVHAQLQQLVETGRALADEEIAEQKS